MAAVIVQIKRNIKAKKEAQEARLARFPRSAKPNENDIILNSAEYDEDIDDAMHEKELTPWVLLNGMIWDCQPWAKQVYADIRVQMFVAVLILGNFVINIIEKQVWPSGKVCELKSYECTKSTKCNCRKVGRRYRRIFEGTGAFFNYIFTAELAWNMYAHWFRLFWKDGWNVFDFITVAVGWITAVGVALPGPLGMLRMVRALRVFRLFKRVKSLRKILESLARAVPGVMNAFLIMLIVMCIYSILAVDFFKNLGQDGVFHYESGFTKTQGITLAMKRWHFDRCPSQLSF